MAKNSLIRWHPTIWTNASLGASITGPASDITNTDNLSVQIILSSGATGDFAIQFANSVDYTVVGTGANFFRQPASTDWVTVIPYDQTNTPVSLAVAGSAGNILVNYANLAYSFVRVIYTRASGTGTVNVWINGKSLSA